MAYFPQLIFNADYLMNVNRKQYAFNKYPDGNLVGMNSLHEALYHPARLFMIYDHLLKTVNMSLFERESFDTFMEAIMSFLALQSVTGNRFGTGTPNQRSKLQLRTKIYKYRTKVKQLLKKSKIGKQSELYRALTINLGI